MTGTKPPNTCWIPGCVLQAGDQQLLCNAHRDRYLTDEKSRAVAYTLWLRETGRLSLGERLGLRLRRLYHVLTSRPTMFVDHFRMESLFLFHYRRASAEALRLVRARARGLTVSDYDNGVANVAATLRSLLADFSVPANAHVDEVRFVLSQLEETPPPQTAASYQLQSRQAPTLVPSPKTVALLFVVSLSLFLVGMVAQALGLVSLVFPFDQRPGVLLATLLAAYLWTVSGSRFLHSLPTVVQKAIEGNLYSRGPENAAFLKGVLWAKASLAKLTDFRISNLGFATGLIVFGAVAIVRKASGLNLLASLAVAIPVLIVYCIALLFQGVLVSVNPIVWGMPKQSFAVDVYDGSRHMGLDAITGMFLTYFTYNLVGYLIWFLALAAVEGTPRIVGFTVLLVVGLFRLGSARRAIVGLLALRRESRLAIKAERASIASMPLGDRITRENVLNSVRYDPFRTAAARKAAGWTITTILLPLLFLLLDRYWERLGALLRSALSLLRGTL